MKKLMLASLFVFISIWSFAPAGAVVVSHLNVDFSNYTLGSVKGQSGGAGGVWAGGVAWFGDVVSVAGYDAGTQVLQVYKIDSGSAGRGSVAINTSLSLASAGKIYMAFDMYIQAASGTLDMCLSNGSVGSPTNNAFGIYVNTTSKALAFNYSTATGGMTRADSSLTPAEDTWYRLEFEITQSATVGVGTFSVFASTPSAPGRAAILTNQAYTFQKTSLPTWNVVPIGTGSAANAVAINNIVLQSGLTDFPEKPFVSSRRLRLVVITSQP